MSKDWTAAAGSMSDLTVIVPTINSGDSLDIFLNYYAQELGLSVTTFVDSKSSDDTLDVARAHCARAVVIQNEHTRVGEIIEAMSRQCATKWILRIDDDELPTVAMLDFVRDAIQTDACDAYSFPRYECAVSPDGQLLRHTSFDSIAHRQWRLYAADRVRYRTTGHSANINLEELKLGHAPPEAAMIHLDWAVHSFERRKDKVARYDAHTPNDGARFRSLILYEEAPGSATRFTRLYLREFAGIGRVLATRFPALTVEPLRCALGGAIAFGGASGSSYLGAGWSHPEDWGRWTDGRVAELRLVPFPLPQADLSLTVRARAFFDPDVGSQRVMVSANGDHIGEWQFDAWHEVERSLRISAAALNRERGLRLRFEIASPSSPRDLGHSEDARSLGFGLIEARIERA